MRHKSKFFSIILLFVWLPLNLTSCYEDDDFDFCRLVHLADLIIGKASEISALVDNQGEVTNILRIASFTVNTITDLSGCTSSGPIGGIAASSGTLQNIFYSPTLDFSNAPVVDSYVARFGEILPGAQAAFIDSVELLVDGYYEIEWFADAADEVYERNEENNKLKAAAKSVIYIHSDSPRKPVYDESTGEQVFVRRIGSRITYSDE